ncbi:MAG: cytidylyltransferase domain-containing protein, partial [Candidatus Binatia bacterium]
MTHALASMGPPCALRWAKSRGSLELTPLGRAPIVPGRSRGRGAHLNTPHAAAARAARDVGRSTVLGCKLRMGADIVAIIPARYRSTRLPGKALAMIGDQPM